jgi:maltose-binding protein MalE
MSGRRVMPCALALALGLAAASCSTGAGQTTSTTAGATTMPSTSAATTTTVPPPSTTTSAGTTTVTASPAGLLVWVDEARRAVLEAAAADFAAATGVPVQIEVVDFGDIRRRMVEQAPLGAGADLFIGSHESLGDLVAASLLEPIDLGAHAEEYLAAGLEAFSSGGRLYGLPYSLEGVALYRNTGLAPEAPVTFEDLLAVCDELGDAIEQCLAIPAGDAYYNYAFLASPGGYIFGYDPGAGYDLADIGVDNEGAVAGMAFLDGLVATGYLDGSVDYGTMARLFFEGRAAFMWTGPWAVPDADDAVAAGTLPGYAVSPLPQILGHEAIPMVRAQGFMVNAFSERKDLALQFLLDYLATPEVMAALYQADPRPPACAATLDALAGDADAQAFAASAAAGRPIPNVPEMGPVWAPLGEAVTAVYQQTSDPETALRAAAEAVRDSLADG